MWSPRIYNSRCSWKRSTHHSQWFESDKLQASVPPGECVGGLLWGWDAWPTHIFRSNNLARSSSPGFAGSEKENVKASLPCLYKIGQISLTLKRMLLLAIRARLNQEFWESHHLARLWPFRRFSYTIHLYDKCFIGLHAIRGALSEPGTRDIPHTLVTTFPFNKTLRTCVGWAIGLTWAPVLSVSWHWWVWWS